MFAKAPRADFVVAPPPPPPLGRAAAASRRAAGARWRGAGGACWWSAALACWLAALGGCVSLDLDGARKLARLTSFTSSDLVAVRKTPRNPLAGSLSLWSSGGPKPTSRTLQLLRKFDLEAAHQKNPQAAIDGLAQLVAEQPDPELYYALAELNYVQAKRAEGRGLEEDALDLHAAAVANAYFYLFDPRIEERRNAYDPEFRGACDLYNSALEGALRVVHKQGKLRPGFRHSVETKTFRFDVSVETRGRWHFDDFDHFEFVSDYELKGLPNHYVTYGLGVPLIAVRKQHANEDPAERYYPPGLSFPVTAFLRAIPAEGPLAPPGARAPDARGAASASPGKTACRCALELHDPLDSAAVAVGPQRVPLESDLSTPLAYYLNDPLLRTNALATVALLNADFGKEFKGLYMLEPFDPRKMPVLMVHGLWSSPVTWMEMFNDLRAQPEIREHYQFWFYMYPTGQPFWTSARQMREDLAELRRTVDPEGRAPALDQMVLVGHSMGGLVSRLQTVDSGDDFWRIVSDKPLAELKADEETRQGLEKTLFFEANPAIRRVVTIGTPHQGSNFANDVTRFVSHQLIMLPQRMVMASKKVVRDNPGYFRDARLLTINTSIDSLSPKSPIFPVLKQARRAPWVKYHNIVGLTSQPNFTDYVAGRGDGIVALASAKLEGTQPDVADVVVDAHHVAVHRHPTAIVEVRRVLLDHLNEARYEWAQRHAPPREALPASYDEAPPDEEPMNEAPMDEAP